MVASVIPAIRAPRRVAFFDYAVPEGLELVPGDLVRIPFRTKTLIGVVASLAPSPATPTRALKLVSERYADLRFSSQTLQLLNALAIRSFSSPASVLHAWIGALPKKPKIAPSVTTSDAGRQRALLPTHEVRLLTDRWSHPDGVIATARNAAKEGKRVLILTPWSTPATALAEHLDAPVLSSELAAGARFRAWNNFVCGHAPILVATRVGAWLATEADLVIVDEPENDDHKQDELAPRYDARWMVEEAHRLGAAIISIGLTPRLGHSSDATIPTIATNLHAIDIHRSDWSPVASLQNRTLNLIEEARADKRPCIIIHPIHGDRARLRCVDCGWSPTCPRCGASPNPENGRLACHRCGLRSDMMAACPSCSCLNLSKSRPGRDTLKQDLATQQLGDVRVMSLGDWNASTFKEKNPLIVLTDLSLLPGGGEDIRRRERLLIAFRRLADVCAAMNADLVVQSDAEMLTAARNWLSAEGCAADVDREFAERKAFKLPPATRLVKLIARGFPSQAAEIVKKLKEIADTAASILGPYAVERLPGSRMPRSIIQIIFPLETADTTIQAVLQPILTDEVLIDLDPIAFFE